MAADLEFSTGMDSKETYRGIILVIDARALMRGCIAHVLKVEFPNLDIVEVSSPQCCAFMNMSAPRLIIYDLDHEGLSDVTMLQNLEDLRLRFPETPIALMGDEHEQSFHDAKRWGCNGYVSKSLPLAIAVAAFRLILVGGVYYPQSQPQNGHEGYCNGNDVLAGNGPVGRIEEEPFGIVVTRAPERAAMTSLAEPIIEDSAVIDKISLPSESLPGFTPRELQVIESLQKGRSNKVIAGDLSLSENTVKVHVRHIMRKLQATNRTQAALRTQALRDPGQALN